MHNMILDNASDHPTQREFFYVTATDAGKYYPLAGPYDTYDEASAKVYPARMIATDHARNSQAGRAAFMAYGVTKLTAQLPRMSSLGKL